MLNVTVRFFTDTATLAVFDPAVLAHRVEDDVDWWCGDFAAIDEVRNGSASIVSVGSDGVYQVRITDADLTEHERDYAAELISGLGLTVQSGSVYVGPGECLPSDGHALDESAIERGALLQLMEGNFLADLYRISWFEAPIWWRESGQAPDDAPADFVVKLRERVGPYPGLCSSPRFTNSSQGFLFSSQTRRVGPEPGMILKSKVRKNPDGQLSVAECGPGSYRVALEDYSMVRWRQHFRFQVISVDHVARSMCGRFVEFVD
jgi:hypothetical protein